MWIDILKREVETKGPVQVAKELCVSRATIDLVCRNQYGADTARIQSRVEKIYGGNGMVPCPVLGCITPDACATKWNLAKKIGLRAGNPETLRLYKACSTCGLRK